jgi:hypothetical protein
MSKITRPWPRVGRGNAYTQDMETLPDWKQMWDLHRPQESEVHLHPTRPKPKAKKMVEIDQGVRSKNHYHPGKANIVADVLSQKANCHHRVTQESELCKEMQKLNLTIVPHSLNYNLSVHPILDDQIKKAQKDDAELMKIKAHTGENKAPDFRVDQYEILWFKKRLCVPEQGYYRNTIMDEPTTLPTPSILEPPRCMWT